MGTHWRLERKLIVMNNSARGLTERITQAELHARFLAAIGPANVRLSSAAAVKPLEVDLSSPLPQRLRVYMYNATRPPGGRPLGEHKIQLIVPGQGRQDRGSFDYTDGRIVLLVGYAADENVFVFWDADLYVDFAWSRNVQVNAETIIAASSGRIATQQRRLRPNGRTPAVETVVAVRASDLTQALLKRMDLTRERLVRE